MSFPVNGILDNFNRSDTGPPPSASWAGPLFTSDNGGLKVISNQCGPDAATNFGQYGDYWNTTVGPDCEVYFTIQAIDTQPAFCLLARFVNPNLSTESAYQIEFDNPNIFVQRIDNNAYTVLGATISQTLVAGNGMGMSVIGTTITAYVNTGSWASVGTRTDSTYSAAGFIAAQLQQGNSGLGSNRIDDFGGGTVVSGAGDGLYHGEMRAMTGIIF